MSDRLAVLGYLVARSHIRGFSIVESDDGDLPHCVHILFWDAEDEPFIVKGIDLNHTLDHAIDTIIGFDIDAYCDDEMHA